MNAAFFYDRVPERARAVDEDQPEVSLLIGAGNFMADLFQQGLLDASGNVVKDPGLPDLVTVPEIYRQVYGKEPSGPIWEGYKLIAAASRSYCNLMLFPPKTPPEIVEICRKAATEMVKDSKFRKDISLINPANTHYVGNDLVRSFKAGVTGPTDVVNFVKDFLNKEYGYKFE